MEDHPAVSEDVNDDLPPHELLADSPVLQISDDESEHLGAEDDEPPEAEENQIVAMAQNTRILPPKTCQLLLTILLTRLINQRNNLKFIRRSMDGHRISDLGTLKSL